MSGEQDVIVRECKRVESYSANCTEESVSSSNVLFTNQQETNSSTHQALQVFTIDKNFLVSQLENGELCAADGTILRLHGPLQIDEAIAIDQDHLEGHEPSHIQQTSFVLDAETTDSVQAVLASVQQALLHRLDQLEKKVNDVDVWCESLSRRVDNVIASVKVSGPLNRVAIARKNKAGTIIVGLPSKQSDVCTSEGSTVRNSLQLINLNSENDYPNGSWLGSPEDPEMRVRCHILPSDLEAVNQSCATPEKMALTLLDYLFDRDTQACSNISGTGRHGKKQLDPLKIYGIKCHLMYKFHISAKDWHRIQQNLDSKCRTAFRRKQRGMPLTVKAFRNRVPQTYVHVASSSSELIGPESPSGVQHDLEFEPKIKTENHIFLEKSIPVGQTIPVSIQQADEIGVTVPIQCTSQMISTEHGDVQVIHATPEQLAQIQQNHQIHILSGAEMLREMESEDAPESISIAKPS
ncbi:protein BANP-like [Limulus polyphemus]|uniref:Protein BANP n=1 Tax=Limulus polyphemus TaxID=6850 RepID=A0ABM1SS43_LIMPO|nr:protein BANP-like [Limulus polyphemus]XP_022246449.1 protein BANP-like [Limulus polyphemus]